MSSSNERTAYLVASFIVGFPSWFLSAFALHFIWDHFVVPFGVHELTMAHAFGVYSLVVLFARASKDLPDDLDELKAVRSKQIGYAYARASVSLAIAWSASRFM